MPRLSSSQGPQMFVQQRISFLQRHFRTLLKLDEALAAHVIEILAQTSVEENQTLLPGLIHPQPAKPRQVNKIAPRKNFNDPFATALTLVADAGSLAFL